MDVWRLPKSLMIGDQEFEIRTDYRDILKILMFFSDPNYDDVERWMICLRILFPDWRNLPTDRMEEIYPVVREFLDMGQTEEDDGKKRPNLMDWQQDSKMIISSVNKVVGHDVRGDDYMHWWTFLAAYMEIDEGAFSNVISIRRKKSKGKKLEKWEQDFYNENRKLIDLKPKYTKEELEEQERWKALLDG